ncbi:MAG TPA: VOC family protein [Candidatus Limnocylindria bacterium]|nr:VOC family protein [Candidatus Limnocylindria bacterium]
MPISNADFHHLGVAVPDLSRALADYASIFGYVQSSGPFDDPIQKVSVCFIEHPQGKLPVLELIAPIGEDSPVKRLLKSGGGAYHICYSVADIEQTLVEVRGKGCLVISGPVPAVAFEGRRIAWFYTPARQLVEVVERETKS